MIESNPLSHAAQQLSKAKISTLVPFLSTGSAVTLHRSHTDNVVTEWESVRLTGRTVRERTHFLKSIAHPDFLESLQAQAEELGYWERFWCSCIELKNNGCLSLQAAHFFII